MLIMTRLSGIQLSLLCRYQSTKQTSFGLEVQKKWEHQVGLFWASTMI